MRSMWRWDHAATDAQGNRCRMREMLAPGSKLPAPDPFDTARMRQWEGSALKTGYKDCPLRNRQHDDLHGAEVTDVDWVIRQAIKAANTGVCGGMATSGTEVDPHWILLTGDGAGLTADDSGIRIAAVAGSVNKMNQSVHNVWNLVFYRANKHAEHHSTLVARLAGIHRRVCEIYESGMIKGEPGEEPIYVKFLLTADKPFHCHVLGRRSFAYDYFSPQCDCKRADLYNLTFDPLEHYRGISFEERCARALVPEWEALGKDEPADWSIERPEKTWSKSEVIAKRKEVADMNSADREKFLDEWSAQNFGQEFGRAPALPYHEDVSDMLHLYINQWNAALTEAFHKHLLAEDYTDKELRARAAGIRDEVNTRLHQEGTNLILHFGVQEKSHAVNGPKLKKFLRDATLLTDLIELMRPLYEMMELKKLPAVKWPESLSLLGQLDAAAGPSQSPAAPTASRGRAGRPGRGARPPRGGARRGGPTSYTAQARRSAVASAGPSATAASAPAPASDAASRPTYLQRVCMMFYALCTHWELTHADHGDASDMSMEKRKELGLEAAELGKEVERAMLACMGVDKQRTYAHDIMYGLPKLYRLLGKPYLGATEGNEHAHQEMKTYFRQMCSHSDKNKCDCLQFMNLHTLNRIAVRDLIQHAPQNKYVQSMSGVSLKTKGGERTVKVSDLTIADNKANLALKRGEDAEIGISQEDFVSNYKNVSRRTVTRPSSPEPSSSTSSRKRPADAQGDAGSDVSD